MIVRTLLLPFLLLAGGCATLRGTPGQPLRVMTYNIQYGGGGTNIAGIASVIRAASPDIVALQEVDVNWSARSGFADQASALAAALGMEVRFAPIYDIADSGATKPPRRFGVAVLSRHRFTSFTNHDLVRLSTQDSATGPRRQPGLLEAEVDVRGTRVRVFNTHLDYRANPTVRARQVREMLTLIGESAGPIIVFGDMNAEPDDEELQPLLARFRDAWDRGTGPGFTYGEGDKAKRIDYVLVSDDLRVMQAWVPQVGASDHRPVVVDLIVFP